MPTLFYNLLANKSPFTIKLIVLALAVLLCGCAGTTPVGNKFLATASSSDLKASLVVGKTPRDEVIAITVNRISVLPALGNGGRV